jgi:hypothetical protein
LQAAWVGVGSVTSMLRRFALGGVAVAAIAVALPAPTAGAAANCLPDGAPLYVDYANSSVDFRDQLFKRPGLILTMDDVPTKQGDPAAGFRQAGAVTTYWDEHLEKIVGTPQNPANPSTIGSAAGALVQSAKQSSGCTTPLIALNELLPPGGASSSKMAQYRSNVLALLKALNGASVRPVLALPFSTPTSAGAAADFLKQAGSMSSLVLEVYFNNNRLFQTGALLASRSIRIGFRQRIAALEALGIPADDLGIMLGFQSAPGQNGREGLQPTASWLEMVKLQELAAKQVASDTGIATIWSWGWGTFSNTGSADADKGAAACVWLWSRDPTLCNAPASYQFNTDLTEGQINLPAGVQCGWNGGQITTRDWRRLSRAMGGNTAKALSALLERGMVQANTKATGRQIKLAENAIIKASFKGSARRYSRALRTAKLARTTARQIIGDQLAEMAVAAKVRPQTYPVWLGATEQTALSTTTCQLDIVPAAGHVDLANAFPFLRVAAPKAPATRRPAA